MTTPHNSTQPPQTARRNRLYRVRALVLKRMDLGEADRILTLLTREQGKLRAIAKGVRRTTSRSAGHVELFTLSDMLLARGRELDVVSQAEIIAPFRRVREEVDLTTRAYYLAELTDLLAAERQENALLFDALAASLTALEEGANPRLVITYFQVRALDLLGYRPELTQCVSCRAEITPGGNRFAAHLGGALCPACGRRDIGARPISDTVLKLLRHLQRSPSLPLLNVPETVSRDAEVLLRDYAEGIIERRMQAPQLIARLAHDAEPLPPRRPVARE